MRQQIASLALQLIGLALHFLDGRSMRQAGPKPIQVCQRPRRIQLAQARGHLFFHLLGFVLSFRNVRAETSDLVELLGQPLDVGSAGDHFVPR